ncbi:FAD-dependent monooxygenase [Stenotrophomonas sp. SMYL86]|uniref:FAD-dependent monooxygenase n=1 Tax=Stenotrophomonas sp. SMYL86 TaxID=3076044 RepID=UPI002E7A667B|nr:FAD-dependent monooxygenase [Stenotrophomonas sp. SMYL86]
MRTALIIGGSLAGLSAALALANVGVASTVLERAPARGRAGVAIRAGGTALRMAFTVPASQQVVDALGGDAIEQAVLPHAWSDVYSALRQAASVEPGITLVDGEAVATVGERVDAAWARSAEGREWTADLLIGADGHRSVVRRCVAPEQPEASYAGYLAWLGQLDVPPRNARALSGVEFHSAGHDVLAIYPLLEAAHATPRRVGWAWFEARSTRLLQALGAVCEDRVRFTPRADAVPADARIALANRARVQWPAPWGKALSRAIRQAGALPMPISEYVPTQVARGRLALVGDAAHAQSPMTGAGFAESMLDALHVSRALRLEPGVVDALALYQQRRLPHMREQVLQGQVFGRSFRDATSPGAARQRWA